jgi:hypothetical protein
MADSLDDHILIGARVALLVDQGAALILASAKSVEYQDVHGPCDGELLPRRRRLGAIVENEVAHTEIAGEVIRQEW